MPTLRTVTVKPSGGDYTSLSAAVSGEAADLVSLDRQLDIECYSMNDTTQVTVTGYTTDATRYIRIYTPSAERHAGVWNTGKYRLSVSGASNSALVINEDYVRVEGLQIEQTAGFRCIYVNSTANSSSSDIRVSECIIRKGCVAGADGSVACESGQTTLRNCIVYGGSQAGLYAVFGTNAAVLNANNCTVAGFATYGVFKDAGGTITLQNCYSGGNTTEDYNGTMTRTTCAHSSATSFAGSTASVAHSTANFTNVSVGSEDYHLVSGASATLLTGGTDLSGTFTTDIDGIARTVPWSIGADEIFGVVTEYPAGALAAQRRLIRRRRQLASI